MAGARSLVSERCVLRSHNETREANESAPDQSGNRDAAPSFDGGDLVTGQPHFGGNVAAAHATRAQSSAARARINTQDSIVRSHRAANGTDAGGRAALAGCAG